MITGIATEGSICISGMLCLVERFNLGFLSSPEGSGSIAVVRASLFSTVDGAT